MPESGESKSTQTAVDEEKNSNARAGVSRDALGLLLEESAVPYGFLWSAVWGAERNADGKPTGRPQIVADLCASIRSSSSGVSVLIGGGYGTGKSSFMHLLRKSLMDSDGNRTPISVWIHLPALVRQNPSSTLAAVLLKVVSNTVEALSPGAGSGDAALLLRAARDLWEFERDKQGLPSSATPSAIEPPRPDGLPGQRAGAPFDYQLAYTLEDVLEKFLDDSKAELTVFLDDVDRCGGDVAMGIIELLLRFGGKRQVNFVVACDRRVMEHGVQMWFEKNGLGVDKKPLVTANSALEKYLHVIVDMPTMADEVFAQSESWAGNASDATRRELFDLIEAEVESLQRQFYGRLFLLFPSREEFDDLWQAIHGSKEVGLQLDGRGPDEYPRRYCLVDAYFLLLLRSLTVADLRTPTVAAHTGQDSRDKGMASDGRDALSDASADDAPQEPDAASQGMLTASRDVRNKIQSTLLTTTDVDKVSGKIRLFSPLPGRLARALRELLIRDEETVWARAGSFPLLSSLTPRQLKFYLRERLISGGSGNYRRFPANALLREIFPPFDFMRKEEWGLFSQLQGLARQMLTGSRGKPDATLLALFEQHLRKVTEAATSQPQRSFASYWPNGFSERRLLLCLFANASRDDDRGGAPSASSGGRSGYFPQPDATPEFHSSSSGEGGTSIEIGSLAPDPDFVTWANSRTGQRLEGANLDEQIVAFGEIATASEESAKLAVEYFLRFWSKHAHRVTSNNAAIALSNLAIILDDVDQEEHVCDALYSRAIEVYPQHPRMRVGYSEFLLDCLGKPSRLERLINQTAGKYGTHDALAEHIRSVLSDPCVDASPNTKYRAIMVQLGLNARQGGAPVTSESVRNLVQNTAETWSGAIRLMDLEPYARLAGFLDSMLGEGQQYLTTKASIYMDVWSAIDDLSIDSIYLRTMVANSCVGESEPPSAIARLGLCLNRGILSDEHVKLMPFDRIARIWSQSGAVLGRRGHPWERIALGFRFALQDPGHVRQCLRRLNTLDGKGGIPLLPRSPQAREDLLTRVTQQHDGLVAAMAAGTLTREQLMDATEFVFGVDYPPVRTLAEFREGMRVSGTIGGILA